MKIKYILLWIAYYVTAGSVAAQQNNHWIIFNSKSAFDKDYDRFYPAINVNFNTEPPTTTEYPNPKGFFLESHRQFSLSDKKGNLALFNSMYQGFFNDKGNIYKVAYPDSFFYSYNISTVFPTDNDSLYAVYYTQKVPNKQISYGYYDYKFRYGIFNIHTKKFVLLNQVPNLPPAHQNKLSNYNYFGQLRGIYFMWQYLDEKENRHWFFYNIHDSVFSAEFDTKNRNFKAPSYSGLRTEVLYGNRVNSSYTTIYTGVEQTDKLIFNSTGTKAYYFDIGQRYNVFGFTFNYSSVAILAYDFDKHTGKFSNETVIDSAKSIATGWYTYSQRFNASDMVLAGCDSILYLSVYQEKSKASYKLYKYVLGSDKQVTKYEYPYPDNKWPDRLSLAPNGKIYVIPSWKSAYPNDSFIMAIDNPDDPGPLLKYNPKGIRIYSDFAATKTHNIKLAHFPNQYGLYKRVSFSTTYSCNEKSMQFINHSDTFWFKRFRYYFGNGDSTPDIDYHIKTTHYTYNKGGRYLVKLRAFTRDGASVWYSDSITVLQAPDAYFTLGILTGCQWAGYNLFDSSVIYRSANGEAIHTWTFGNGKDSTWHTSGDLDEKRDMRVVYQKDGIYTVTHTVDDGYCKNTYTRTNQVTILPAPRPGITITPQAGCTPLDVKLKSKYVNMIDSVRWYSSAGHNQATTAQSAVTFQFNDPGDFTIWQKQYGVTGCITTDSTTVGVVKGFDAGIVPYIISASNDDNNVVSLSWTKQGYVRDYTLWRNGTRILNTTDTFYFDYSFQKGSINTYEITANDHCGNPSSKSNSAQTILLAGKETDGIALLRWNAYNAWAGDVQRYDLEYQNSDGYYNSLDSVSGSITEYSDSGFMVENHMEKCFRITAYEQGNFQALSHSNTLCIPYRAIIWIPNAISPNGDGFNDELAIKSYGIKTLTFSIYNRWGEKVFESSDLSCIWRPGKDEAGVYMYLLQAAAESGGHQQLKGTITVVH